MRRLPKDGIAYHAFCRPVAADTCHALVEAIARSLGLPVVAASSDRYPEWRLGNGGGVLSLSVATESPWSQLHVGVEDEQLAHYGSARLAELLCAVSDGFGVRLGRTGARGGVAYVSESELAGSLEFVDWLQYWAQPIVARWGVDALMAGPFSTVQRRADGAAMLLLAAEPDDQGMSRKSAAEFLGIRLRPLYAKVADGARVELPWR